MNTMMENIHKVVEESYLITSVLSSGQYAKL